MEKIAEQCMGDAPAYCVATCPLHVDARGYIKLIGEGKFREAVKLIREKLPFPACLGRICAHPCEEKCKRHELGQPMAIAALKRFAANYDRPEDWDLTLAPEKSQKVAVIGLGPAGAMAAYDLRKMGYQVTAYEALPVPGGMLRVGIPAYRLPRDIIDFEFGVLSKLGVTIHLNTRVGKDISLEEIRRNFDAVFVAIGAHKSAPLPVPGSNLPGVLSGVDFLRDVSLGRPVNIGKRVVVIGGGNVAIDVARTALRVGAEQVDMVCLESRDTMPAHPWEIDEAICESVNIHCCWGPQEFSGQNGVLTGVSLKECTAVFDAQGRFNPVYNEGNTKWLPADTVIVAIGQVTDSALGGPDLTVSRGGKFVVDPVTLATNVPGIFAGGDAAGRPLLAVEALAAGRKAAVSIDRFLQGEDLTRGREGEGPFETWLETTIDDSVPRLPRVAMATLPVAERRGNFREVELGFSEEEAVAEARRCLACECKVCVRHCEFMTQYNTYPKELARNFLKDPAAHAKLPYYCNLCNVCTVHCPKEFKISEMMLEVRRELVRQGHGPLPEHKPIHFHQKFGVSSLFTVTLPDKNAGYTKRVFFPGCSLPSYSPALVEKTLRYLQEKLPGTGIVMRCCAAPTYALGQEKEFAVRFDSLLKEVASLGADEIICACPDCFHNISHHAPHLTVKSLYPVLKELGIPEHAKGMGQGQVFSLHDSCVTRDHGEIHDSVRDLIKQMGYQLVEMQNIRDKTRCCGFGGMVVPVNPQLAQKIMKRRAGETEEKILTYCAACRESMTMGGREALHVLDLMFNDTWKTKGIPGVGGSLKGWANRLRTKWRVKKI